MPTGSPLPHDLAVVVDDYRTCEFATVTRAGVAIAWPTVALYDDTASTFTLTTSIALPTKAVNIRREPQVSLLFSDPTGSGSTSLPQVLVRGRAACPDEIVTRPAGLERYWARLYERQPAGKVYGSNALTRRLMDWYYFRLVITVTPESYDVRDPLPDAGPLPAGGAGGAGRAGGAMAATLHELPHYRSAVLSWVDADGGPTSARVRPAPTDSDALSLDAEGLRAGPASLLCHSHDDKIWSQRSFVTVGTVASSAGDWVFRPERFIPGSSARPQTVVRSLRNARATSKRYLAKRGLPRPSVAWDEFAALHPHRHG